MVSSVRKIVGSWTRAHMFVGILDCMPRMCALISRDEFYIMSGFWVRIMRKNLILDRGLGSRMRIILWVIASVCEDYNEMVLFYVGLLWNGIFDCVNFFSWWCEGLKMIWINVLRLNFEILLKLTFVGAKIWSGDENM